MIFSIKKVAYYNQNLLCICRNIKDNFKVLQKNKK